MKTMAKQKAKRHDKLVRETTSAYRTTSKHAKCRTLTGEELVELVKQMIAAKGNNDKSLLRRLEREFTNGFYGEIRA